MIENIENKGIGEKYKMQYIFSINIMYFLFFILFILALPWKIFR